LFSALNDFRSKILFGESGIGENGLRRNSFSAKVESAKFTFGESGIGEIRLRRKWKLPLDQQILSMVLIEMH
jgi:hypothetical protein